MDPGQIVPLMQSFLNWFPSPNFTDTAVSQGYYNYVLPVVTDTPVHQVSLRLDYAPGDKWRISGRWQGAFFGTRGVKPQVRDITIDQANTTEVEFNLESVANQVHGP